MAGIAFLAPLLILLLGRFSKVVGWVLLATFIAFSVYSIRGRISLQGETEEVGSSRWAKELGMILGGIVVVIVSSQFVVNSSVEISNLLGIDQSVIGATVIAVGTSLPELSVSLAAVKKARASLALGNILGSCVTNLTLILGFVLAVSPLKVNPILFADLVIMLIIVNLALWGVVADHKIGFGGGITLLLLYIVFAVSTLGIQVVLLSPEYLTHFVTIAVNTAVQLFPYALVGSVAFALGFSLGRG